MRARVFGCGRASVAEVFATVAWCMVCRLPSRLEAAEDAPVCPHCGLSEWYTFSDPDLRDELPN